MIKCFNCGEIGEEEKGYNVCDKCGQDFCESCMIADECQDCYDEEEETDD